MVDEVVVFTLLKYAHKICGLASLFLNARILIIGSPSGCVRSEISGMTQVDEKGREGNSSSHSLYMLEETWSGIYLS